MTGVQTCALPICFDPLNAADAALDADGDGQTNLTEYRAGTDPRDGTSLFSITNLAADAGSIVLTWRSAPGRRYHVQSSDDLAVWTVLSDSGAPVVIDAASGNTTTFPVTTAPGTEHRFYRIELLP